MLNPGLSFFRMDIMFSSYIRFYKKVKFQILNLSLSAQVSYLIDREAATRFTFLEIPFCLSRLSAINRTLD